MTVRQWKPIKGYEAHYDVSNDGEIRSLKRAKPLILNSKNKHHRYYKVNLSKNGKEVSKKVHRVVYETFVGEIPNDLVVCHINGNRYDNRLENLKLVTQKENMSHMDMHGTRARNEKHGQAKLSNKQVLDIKELLSQGVPCTKIAPHFSVSPNAILNIKHGVTWVDITA